MVTPYQFFYIYAWINVRFNLKQLNQLGNYLRGNFCERRGSAQDGLHRSYAAFTDATGDDLAKAGEVRGNIQRKAVRGYATGTEAHPYRRDLLIEVSIWRGRQGKITQQGATRIEPHARQPLDPPSRDAIAGEGTDQASSSRRK